ncbi:carbohydrate binding family 9 domain-containing protein [Candidatus Aminicenantes bacterium AC-335-A11]|jgi:hypothetical protein|nr:carbohydrate binding family 9 domain-containing protein [SCandidatus Aminicenantes bacterium Aminicenantia_JdfR_composite]MCP2596302.1 carbohydrate binding family 9 domain-containing protein [Candidatus Aminicenantes bacterium AC-335-G13]MCP2597877.1 carbohydrate binding family 9 domain-containing protein [Candidatus Aminicenantes bacterium AC-335-L06]MCP2618137.1 carbohydrate binding family 9 domain-containing protein [Candidatus Aminicenantes bacterium AC-335-A11]MCP2620466.1 carbohydrate 
MANGVRFKLLIIIFFSLKLLLNAGKINEKYYIKVPKLSQPPVIDGLLNDECWKEAFKIEKFTQFEPKENSPPTEKTIAYIGYDKKNLYVAFQCFDSEPDKIRASLSKRDHISLDDFVGFVLDTFNAKKRAFQFVVNPLGIQEDSIVTEEPLKEDLSWDTYFISKGRINKDGYTVEIAIPFKSIRFPNTSVQRWGIHIFRRIRRKSERIHWIPLTRDITGYLIQAGTLEIDGEIERGRNLEIMPVATGLKRMGENFDSDFGLNFKYGITSNLTADFSYNPDFSHIEADLPQVDINLRYALYYPEKRPFFYEAKDIFETLIPIVYTRRIIDPLWGAKLTGKIGKTTIGYINAYDENPTESLWEISGVESRKKDNALFNILRLKRDLYSESYIGFILTDKEIGQNIGSLSRYNRVFGLDGQFKFKKYYYFTFQALYSKTKFKNKTTSLVPALALWFKHSSRKIFFDVSWFSIHPDFEASSGFIIRNNVKEFDIRLAYKYYPQKKFLIFLRPMIHYRRWYDFKNILTDEAKIFSIYMRGSKETILSIKYSDYMERWAGINFHKNYFYLSASSQPFKWLSGSYNFLIGDGIYYDPKNPYLGFRINHYIKTEIRPSSILRISYYFKNSKFFKKKGGEKVYDINTIRQKITLQISRTLSFRFITDYHSYYKKLFNSFLISWEYRPGTTFYLGFDDTQEKEMDVFVRKKRTFFVKFSYWWRF